MIDSLQDCISPISMEIMVEATVLDCGHRFDAPEVKELQDNADRKIQAYLQLERNLFFNFFNGFGDQNLNWRAAQERLAEEHCAICPLCRAKIRNARLDVGFQNEIEQFMQDNSSAEERQIYTQEKARRAEAARAAEAERVRIEQEAAARAEQHRLQQEEAARIRREREEAERVRREQEAAARAEQYRLQQEEAARAAEAERVRRQQEAARAAEAERVRREQEAARAAEAERVRREQEAARAAEAERVRVAREQARRTAEERNRVQNIESIFSHLANRQDVQAYNVIQASVGIAGFNINAMHMPDRLTFLDYAVKYGCNKSAELLIQRGANLHTPDESMFSALASNNDAGFIAQIENRPATNLLWLHPGDNLNLMQYAEKYNVPASRAKLQAIKASLRM